MRQGYGIMPNEVLFDSNITDKAKLLYISINSLCAEKGYCWATNKYLADKFDTSERTISRRITELQKYIGVEYLNKGTKLERRKIYIDKNVLTPRQNCPDPLDKNVGQNNINNNNINNTKANAAHCASHTQDAEEIYELYCKSKPIGRRYRKKLAIERIIKVLKLKEYNKEKLIQIVNTYKSELSDIKYTKNPEYFFATNTNTDNSWFFTAYEGVEVKKKVNTNTDELYKYI